jgi:hypothetical protein
MDLRATIVPDSWKMDTNQVSNIYCASDKAFVALFYQFSLQPPMSPTLPVPNCHRIAIWALFYP